MPSYRYRTRPTPETRIRRRAALTRRRQRAQVRRYVEALLAERWAA